MKKITLVLLFTALQGNSLRLVQDYYDNRIPKKIFTYKETSTKLILKASTSYYKNGQVSYKVEYDADGLNSRNTWWHSNGNKSKMITFKDGRLESSSFKRIAINIDKNFTSEITIPQDMKDVSMYHFLRICDGDKENGPIQVNFEPGPNKALS